MLEHALLSASGSGIWLHCTPAVRLCEKMADTPSVYSEEGTLAHSIVELKMKKTFIEPKMPKSTFSGRLNKLKKNELYHEEMLEYTDNFIEIVQSIHIGLSDAKVFSEVKVSYSDYAPEGFGTADCIVIGTDRNTNELRLVVIDFKYGKGERVTAEDNVQLMLYALGAYSEFGMVYDFDTVTMMIVQPRLEDGVTTWTIPLCEILDFGEYIKPIAEKAFRGEGEFVAGEHCRWCKVKSTCKTRANKYLALEDAMSSALTSVNLMSPAELGAVLKRGIGLMAWIRDLEEYALAEALKGVDVEGWKVVEGRSNRKIVNVDGAFKVLNDNGFEETMLYKREPLGITALESLVGKKQLTALIHEFIEKPQGKPTLVVVEDKREAFVPSGSAIDDFKEVLIYG